MSDPKKVQPGQTADLLRVAIRRSIPGLAFAVLIGLLINVLQLISPMYMLQVYDRVMPSRSTDTLFFLTMLAAAGFAFLCVLDYMRSRVFMVIGEQLARRLNGQVLQAAVSDFLRTQSPLAANAMRDLQELRQFVTGGPIALPLDAAFAPLFIFILALLHPAYAVVSVIAVVFMVVLSIATELVARAPSVKANELALKSHAEVSAAIRHAEVIESMGMLEPIAGRWREGQNRALALVGAGNSGAKGISAIARSFRLCLQMTIVALGAILAINHETSGGSLMAVTMLANRLLQPFEHLIDGWRQWSSAGSSYSRLKTLFNSFDGARSPVPLEASHGRLVIDGVTFVPPTGDNAILKGVRFTVEPGEVLGIVGPSGAGKSTLARLLVGVWAPSYGGVYLDGHDVATWERQSFGRQIGYLPQNAVLLDGTVRENIARFGGADPAEVVAAAKKAQVHEIIGRLPLGYETPVGEAGFALSGGQRQRIALARALFGNPKLLVLDEPNSNVDGEGERALSQAIRDARQAGATVVIIPHRMSVMSVADRLLVLRDGAVERIGPPSEVMATLATPAAALPAAVAARSGKVAHLAVERSIRS
ncbi:MAG: type I secretion system permease/ATPase [Hyphomicrobiales bacterium]